MAGLNDTIRWHNPRTGYNDMIRILSLAWLLQRHNTDALHLIKWHAWWHMIVAESEASCTGTRVMRTGWAWCAWQRPLTLPPTHIYYHHTHTLYRKPTNVSYHRMSLYDVLPHIVNPYAPHAYVASWYTATRSQHVYTRPQYPWYILQYRVTARRNHQLRVAICYLHTHAPNKTGSAHRHTLRTHFHPHEMQLICHLIYIQEAMHIPQVPIHMHYIGSGCNVVYCLRTDCVGRILELHQPYQITWNIL